MTESNLDDVFGEEQGSESLNLGEGAPAESGGEEVSLDPDLASMLGDEGASGGEAKESGGGEGDLDLNLEGGGEGGLDLNLEGGGEGGVDLDLERGSGGEGADMDADAPAKPAGGGRGATRDGLAASKQALSSREAVNLDFLLDVKLDVTFEVGRSKMLISDLLTLGQGSVVELHRLVGEDLDLLVNGKLIAKGEVVVVNEKFGCKISEIVSPEERIKHMGGY